MKKNILMILVLSGIGTAAIFTGCSKDDATPPVVTLIGPASIELSLNTTWDDLGATAEDDEDGDITASISSDYGPTNPNTNHVGYYTVTYTATDAAGNEGTETRSIYVRNDADDYAGTYNVHDTVPGFLYLYPQEITVDLTINNRIHFNRFCDYANNTGIYATKLPNGTIEIPNQTGINIGTQDTSACDVSTHAFTGGPSTTNLNGFTFTYTDQVTAPVGCAGSATAGTAIYTKQ